MNLTSRHIGLLLVKIPFVGLALAVILSIVHTPIWITTALIFALVIGGIGYVIRDGMTSR